MVLESPNQLYQLKSFWDFRRTGFVSIIVSWFTHFLGKTDFAQLHCLGIGTYVFTSNFNLIKSLNNKTGKPFSPTMLEGYFNTAV